MDLDYVIMEIVQDVILAAIVPAAIEMTNFLAMKIIIKKGKKKMTEEKKEVAVIEKDEKTKGFELAQRQATALSQSSMVPKQFQGKENIGNCLIAMELSERMGCGVFGLMQSMYVVYGRPGLEGKFVAALVNQCGKYDSLQYQIEGQGKTDKGIDRPEKCRAYATVKLTGEVKYGPWITWDLVKANGWHKDKGSETSKWQTIPDLMFPYRAATYFQRLHNPELTMGMLSREEIEELPPPPPRLVMDETPPDGTDPYKIKDAPVNEVAKEIVGQVTGTKTDDADQAPLTDSPLPPWNDKEAIDCPRIKQKKFVQVCLKCDEKEKCSAFGDYCNDHEARK